VAFLSEALRFHAAGHLRKATEVTASGPYRWLAHPLYVGPSLLAAGLAIASRSLIGAGQLLLYVGTTIAPAIRTEEAFIRDAFGDRYDRYRRGESLGAGSNGRRFSLAQAVANREHRSLIGLAIVALLLALKAAHRGTLIRTAAG